MIILKPLTIDDADAFYSLYEHPDIHHGREPFLPGESAAEFTRRIIEACIVIYTIRPENDPETIAGDCALHDPDDSNHAVEIGGSLLPAFRGRGYMQAAFRVLERIASEDYHFQRLVAKTEETNLAAIRLVQQLGYSQIRQQGSHPECGSGFYAMKMIQKTERS